MTEAEKGWWRQLPGALKALIVAVSTAVSIFLSGFGVSTAVQGQWDIPASVRSNTARIDRLEIRVDSLLRITTQTFCLQQAQAEGTDWRGCVR